MYEQFYGFKEKPFQITPNPAFLYRSSKHDTALTYLEYGLTENVGFILLTGEIGSGKTTLVQYILGRLESDIEAAVIFNTNVSAEELLALILEEFEIPRPAGGKADVLTALNGFLIERYARRKRVLLVIDEGQNLSDQALEEVRMLSNLQSEDQSLLQIMLVGQPELITKLKQPSMRQFSQRIAASYHLTGLDREETEKYIAHRLQKAGGQPDLFTPAAVDIIFKLSGGIPRAINLVCQAALVYGFAEDAQKIGQDTIHQISKDNLGIGCASATAETCISGSCAALPPQATTEMVSNASWAYWKRTEGPEAGDDELSAGDGGKDPENQGGSIHPGRAAAQAGTPAERGAAAPGDAPGRWRTRRLKRLGMMLKQKLQGMAAAVTRK